MDNSALLKWQLAAGVDEAIADTATNYFALKPPVALITPSPTAKPVSGAMPLHLSPAAASSTARELADKVTTLAELEAAVRGFDGCAIKKTATKTVFADGNPEAEIMVIGEAPGAQEDIQGIPFCGPSGQLLDKMLASIGLDRSKVYITNTIFWRPPANRNPSEIELATCLPFVEKHIALVNPKLLILSGGTAVNALLKKDHSISKLRSKLYDYSNIYMSGPVKTIVTYHPSYLLRTPASKKLAWQDMLYIKKFMGI